MSGLPRGWVESKLGDIGEWSSGGTPSRARSDFYDGDIPWVKTGDLEDRVLLDTPEKITQAGLDNSSAKLFPPGTLLIAMYGATIGKTALLGVSAATNQACAAFLPSNYSEELIPFLWKFVLAKKAEFIAAGQGGAQPNISQALIKQFPILVPPLAEQKRIVAKLDAVNAKSARARTELARIETLVSRYKQAVLSKAFSGELTASYKVQRSNLSEPEEAPRHGRQEEPRKLKVRGATDIMKGIDLPPLPTGWNWVQNHSLAQNSANAICAGPFGTIFKAKDFREKGVPIIFLRHVGPGEYRTHKPGFMDEKVWRDLHQPYSIFGGELLVTKLGDPPGVACVYPTNAGTAMVTPDVIKMSVDESASHPAFLMHYFNSPTAKTIIKELAFGLTRLRVDLAMFKTFPIPLPPLEEQHEIVRRIESAFARIDRLAKEAKRALQLVGRLDEAILAKAFRGELVPQDEGDEPAELLLARIRAEREGAPKGKRGRGAKG